MNNVEFKNKDHWKIFPPTYNSSLWMGISKTLNLTLSGKTLEELSSIIDEGVDLLIEDLKKNNEFEQFCKDRNLNYE